MNDYYKKCAFPKPKMAKKKRAIVSEETYQKVYETSQGRCVLCGGYQNIEAHHIRYRSERKDLINEPSNMVMLCKKCHLKVHSDKKKWQPILLEISKRLYEKED